MSTITLPDGLEVEEGRVLVIPGSATILPPGDLTAAEAQALREDVATAMNQDLDDLANVSETGKVEGEILTVQSDGTWAPRVAPLGMYRVIDQSDELDNAPYQILQTLEPLRATQHPTVPYQARLSVTVGTSANSVAAGDHTHPPTLKGRLTFDEGGTVLGAGERQLVDYTTSSLVPGVTYDISVVGKVEGVNTNSSGRLRLRIQIGSESPQSINRGFSGGVWTEATTDGIVSGHTGTTSLRMQFWAEYISGDPTALYSGAMIFDIAPRGGAE